MTSKNTKQNSEAEYAHAVMSELQDITLAAQIRVLREQRGLTQSELGKLSGMKQERISLLESGEYSSFSLATLRKLAAAFDVGLEVCFAPFSRVIKRLETATATTLKVTGRTNELRLVYTTQLAEATFTSDEIGLRNKIPVPSSVANATGSQQSSNQVQMTG